MINVNVLKVIAKQADNSPYPKYDTFNEICLNGCGPGSQSV